MGCFGGIVVDGAYIRIAIDAHANGLANRVILHGFALHVEVQHMGTSLIGLMQNVLGRIAQVSKLVVCNIHQRTNLARLQRRYLRLVVGQVLRIHSLDFRLALPIGIVGRKFNVAVACNRIDLVGASTHRLVFSSARVHVDDRRNGLGQFVLKGGVQGIGGNSKHVAISLHAGNIERFLGTLVHADGAIKAIRYRLSIEFVAVLERYPFANRDFPRGVVHHFGGLSQHGLRIEVGINAEQLLVDAQIGALPAHVVVGWVKVVLASVGSPGNTHLVAIALGIRRAPHKRAHGTRAQSTGKGYSGNALCPPLLSFHHLAFLSPMVLFLCSHK